MASAPENRHQTCPRCSQLRDWEHAIQHDYPAEEDNVLPEAANGLVLSREITSSLQLLHCPECGAFYLSRFISEFLVGYGGSYAEQYLARLSGAVAAEYQDGRRTKPLPGMD